MAYDGETQRMREMLAGELLQIIESLNNPAPMVPNRTHWANRAREITAVLCGGVFMNGREPNVRKLIVKR
jgi:hypothetical protein